MSTAIARWRRPLATASASRRSSSTIRTLICESAYAPRASPRWGLLGGGGPFHRQPVRPSEALQVLGDDPLDPLERGPLGPACYEHQHVSLPGVQAAAAADDRSEVDEALAVVEGDIELLPAVTLALVGEVLAELPEVERRVLGGDAGSAGEHQGAPPPWCRAPKHS